MGLGETVGGGRDCAFWETGGVATKLDMAWQMLGAGQPARAEALCSEILAGMPNQPGALSCRGMARWQLGRDADSVLSDLEKARRLSPKTGAIVHNLATALASLGRFSEAEAEFRTALALNPGDGAAFLGLVQNARLGEDDPAVAGILAAYEAGRLAPDAREKAGFGLAAHFDRLGDYARAFGFLRAANALISRPYNPEAEQRRLAALELLVREDAFSRLPRSGYGGPAPIFIAGMPRSGTTLVEAIVAAHREVFGAGEAELAGWVEHEMGRHFAGAAKTPDEILLGMGRADLDNAVRAILARVAGLAGRPKAASAGRFTDKTPANSLSVGLIAALFANAKMLFVRRHPLDVGVSNLFTRFSAGQGFAFSLEGIGQHFRVVAETEMLWRWAGLLEATTIAYEKLVADPDGEIRRLLAFCGLDADPACFTPVAAGRAIHTASQHQVRQPISTRSVGRWRHYEPYLGPMIAAMGGMDWIEAYQRDAV